MNVKEQFLIKDIINTFLKEPTEEHMDVLIQNAREGNFSDVDILLLARGLSNSGIQIQFQETISCCDIPSTGGPTSLSTLLCPLMLVYFNNKVIKLGIPGRPAGGIDVLSQIENYNISPTETQIKEWIQLCGYVHFIASDKYVPLDAKLFSYRKQKGLIDIPSLVIASLLSKKLAVGLTSVGLDIRVSSFGNLGKTWDESREHGMRFNRVARLAGIESKCFLTPGECPQQNHIGRGEALLALNKIFSHSSDTFLTKHYTQCLAMASSVGNDVNKGSPTIEDIKQIFISNVVTQGGSMDSFNKIAAEIEIEHKFEVTSHSDGFVAINIQLLREAILNVNDKGHDRFSDLCGVILKTSENDFVSRGSVLATYRCCKEYREEFAKKLSLVFTIGARLGNSVSFEEII